LKQFRNHKIKLAMVCNSSNPDLVEYFKCKIKAIERAGISGQTIVLINRFIKTDDSLRCYISSYTNKAFLDKFTIIDFFVSFYIFAVLLRSHVKIIHFTTAHISNLFLAVPLKCFGTELIFTIHDLEPHPDSKSFFIRIYNYVVINLLADRIISFSRGAITKQKHKDIFMYVPLCGFEVKINKPKSGKYVLFFGRMEKYKGLNHLLCLIEEIVRLRLDMNFVIAGKGNIDNIERFRKHTNVRIINRFVKDDEVFDLFAGASFTILPYDSATQSGVILLSYAHATPVIVYNIGCLNEYVVNGKTGYIVGYKDNNAIVDILKTTNEDKIRELSAGAIQLFQDRYSTAPCERYYAEMYKKLILQ